MYWWNVAKLAEDFQQGRVNEKERFKYYLATAIVWTAVLELAPYVGSTFKLLDLLDAAVGVFGTIIGTLLCYRANKNGDNSDFIGRMICLGWPIGIKLLVLFSIIALPLFFLVGLTGNLSSDLAGDISAPILGILALICYYWLNYKYISLVAQSHMVENLEFISDYCRRCTEDKKEKSY